MENPIMADTLQRIDERRLELDPAYRYQYVSQFTGFGERDIEAIHGMAQHLAPVVPALVDAVYVQLFRYDATKRHFVPRQFGYEGPVPKDLESLTLDDEQIQFRKKHLANYLVRLVTGAYDAKMVGFLDMVGKIHTPNGGSKEISVPLVQMNALMGFVSDALIATILGLNVDNATKTNAVRAFNKLFWVQHDFISRHYAA
jgi:hypothetical protein